MSSLLVSAPASAVLLRPPHAAAHAVRSPAMSAPAGASPSRTPSSVFPFWKPVFPSGSPLRCSAISRSRTREYLDAIQNGLSSIKRQEIVEDDAERETHKGRKSDRVKQLVESVKSMLQSMEDGEISVSPYDTAWVALVPDGGCGSRPQFPECLAWISDNQLPDGSWGDTWIFSIYDRLLNTLACVVALRTWNVHPDKSDKGILFIKENFYKLGDENPEHMPIGFEVALPSMIEIAKTLEIEIPENSPGLEEIYARRELKLTKIPKDILHKVPTTLLHSLEGMKGLMWEKLLELRCGDGSFLFSPSSTAFALKQTKDDKCLKYLSNCVDKFNGGVPNVYPVDLFERIWVVDRLQRLGISRYFESEINECISYVHRYWKSEGICWARNSRVQDIDDTAMGFRLMRLHGYDISADVFRNFEKGGEFFCFAGQSTQAVTGMYNLYRASQVRFQGEDILADAGDYSVKFLREKRADNELLDKWIIAKDLPGEVGYAIDVPYFASLPRLETRFYLEQYGGEDDVWIGKTLYRMSRVSNYTYLELAKLDYNNCQALHRREWKTILKWYKNCGFKRFGLRESNLLQWYYIAAACVFEPEKWTERVGWAKIVALVETIASQRLSRERKRAFVEEFEQDIILEYANGGRYKTTSRLVRALTMTLNQLSLDILLAHGHDIHSQLNQVWYKWLKTWEEGKNNGDGDVELYVHTLNLCGRRKAGALMLFDPGLSTHPKYDQLLKATIKVCHQLRLYGEYQKTHDSNGCKENTRGLTTIEIEGNMQELLMLVLHKSPQDLDSEIKQNCLTIARSFYYTTYFSPTIVDFHITKVLFERVL